MSLRNTLADLLTATRRRGIPIAPGEPGAPGQPGALAAAIARRNGSDGGAAGASQAGEDDYTAMSVTDRAAAMRERGRIKAIINSGAGQANPRLARHLAFSTSLPRNEVLAMLGQAAASASRNGSVRLSDRMAARPATGVGLDAPRVSDADLATRIVSIADRARGRH